MKVNKRLGIIGGMGSRAGANFMQQVIALCPVARDQDFIEIFLHSNSCVPDRTQAILYGGPCPMQEILRSIHVMNANQVDLLVLTCNTSYYYYQQFVQHTDAHILNPAYELRDYLRQRQVRRVGLLATTGTLQSGIFRRALTARDSQLLVLNPVEQELLFMQSVYGEGGLKSAIVTDSAINLMHEAADRLIRRGAEMIVGACSEVSIAIQESQLPVPYLDTMTLLAHRVIEECYAAELPVFKKPEAVSEPEPLAHYASY